MLGWLLIKSLIRLKFPTVEQISTTDLTMWLRTENRQKPLLLDARTFQEYALSHLKDARVIPANLQDLTGWDQLSLSTPIVTYCSVGYRSAALAQHLSLIGYKNVFNLEGSIFQWSNEGRAVYQGKQVVQQVHPYNWFWGYLLREKNN